MLTLASYETSLPSHWCFHIVQISTGAGSERKSKTFISPTDHVETLLQSDLKLLTSPFHYVFSSLGEESNSIEAKRAEVCLWESTHFNSAGVNQPFFHQIAQSSGNIPRLKDCSGLNKKVERSRHLANKGHAC